MNATRGDTATLTGLREDGLRTHLLPGERCGHEGTVDITLDGFRVCPLPLHTSPGCAHAARIESGHLMVAVSDAGWLNWTHSCGAGCPVAE